MFERSIHNPLITPHDVQPTRPDFEVIGTFNAGVAHYGEEIILLLRVAERPAERTAGYVLCPYLNDAGEIAVKRVKKDDPEWDTRDPRKIHHLPTATTYLTSMSHLRLARSKDGVQFTIEESPWLAPANAYDAFGVEDCRITHIGDTYYVNYSAVSSYGISTALVSTHDFQRCEHHGIIFAPSNRNVTIFPERIAGRYVCYHRPMPGMFGSMNIWIARSPDLIHWGQSETVIDIQPTGWESGRVGGGAPPIKTDHGWLSLYHAADQHDFYQLGAFLTPLDAPGHIIARTTEPILSPLTPYETQGFFNNVVFTCGAIVRDDLLYLYYGAADERIALATAPVTALLEQLT